MTSDMDGISFGRHLKLTVGGTSHGPSLRFALKNFPSDCPIDELALAAFMARRAPGRDRLSTPRREPDRVILRRTRDGLSGTIANCDCRPWDYGAERTVPRPGHADFPQWVREGRIPTGGGKNSGRLTAPLCAAGGLCRQFLERRGIRIDARIVSVGGKTSGFARTIEEARRAGDSVGGVVRCTAHGLPAGLGGALFEGLECELSAALFAIPGVKGVAFGNGFDAADLRGSENNDPFAVSGGCVVTTTNRHGGFLGGFTSGMPISFDVAFKPTPTVFKPLPSVDLKAMSAATCAMRGRHDPCIVRRAVPVVEAVTAFVLADCLLAHEAEHPRICLTLTGRTLAENLAQFESQRLFTDMVELRADLLTSAERARVAEFPTHVPVPVVLTFRRTRDGGAYAGDEATRVRFFMRALKANFAYVDLEEDFRVPELERLARAHGTRIIRSRHAFDGPVRNLAATCRALAKAGDVAKIAFRPNSLADVSRAFAAVRGRNLPPHVICAMGPLGVATRVLAGRLGSCWTYASTGGLEGLGHLTPHQLVRDFRFRTATRDADLYGVTGWPLAATRSPEINNAAFAQADVDAVMIPFPAPTARAALAFMRAMDLKGLAVTIPHKRAVLPFLDRIDATARRIGAVNTVVRERGHLVGYNTDVEGFATALTAFLAAHGCRPADCRAAVLGDGGAAQAVKAALAMLKVKFRVFHRETPPVGFDLLVNATPVDPIPDYVFSGRELAYDLGYVPAETPFLTRAHAAGCPVENGFTMLVAQAAGQRRRYGL